MKRLLIAVVLLATVAVTVGAYVRYSRGEAETQISYLAVSRGDVVESVGATGTVQPVRTVMVGSQVSGIIKALHADFNSIVRQGDIIAELDPSLFQTQIEQARANLTRSQTDRDRLRITLDDTKNRAQRTRSLFDRKIATQQDLETAQVNVRSAEASLKASEASIVQSQAALNQTEVSLAHTVIRAPIDGIVISRNVDVGQTVAASMNAPVLFIIAADLTKMQVIASVDESDVGRIRPGQTVRFRVDAYATEEFLGSVAQVRLQPIVSQNVVTYATVIDVPNPALKLKPGMTANVTIEIAKRTNVLRVPNASLRFIPTTDTFAALNQEVPPEMQRAAGGTGGFGRPGAAGGPGGPSAEGGGTPAPATTSPTTGVTTPPAARSAADIQTPRSGTNAAALAPALGAPQIGQDSSVSGGGGSRMGDGQRGGGQGRGGFGGGPMANLSPEERQKRFQERMQNMSPEEREQFAQRMRDRGIDPSTMGAGGPGGPRARAGRPAAPAPASPQPGRAGVTRAAAQTIDQLFGPLPTTETPGRAWIHVNQQIKSVRLRLGITDGTYTELLTGEIQAGQELVTSVITPAQAAAASTRSPLTPGGPGMPGQRPGGMPGMGGGGRGGH